MYKSIKTISYRSSSRNGQPIPLIAIQGIFLNNFGFRVGEMVRIAYENGKIEIEKLNNNQIK